MAWNSLEKHLRDLNEDSQEFFISFKSCETDDDRKDEIEMIKQTFLEKQKWINAILGTQSGDNRIKRIHEMLLQIEKLKQERRNIMQLKERKILKIVRAKNELAKELEEIKDKSEFVLILSLS